VDPAARTIDPRVNRPARPVSHQLAIVTSVATTLSHRHQPGTARAALAYRDFRTIWLGSFASNIGTWMQSVLLPAYVFDRTGSARIVSYLVFAQLGPLLLLSIPAGVIADKLPRAPWLIATQAVQMVCTFVVAAAVAADGPIAAIVAAQLAIGTGNALGAPAFQSSIPMLVDRRDLPGAVSLNSVMINGSRVIGPVVAAVLGAIGISTAGILVVNGLTYLFVIAALLLVRVPSARGTHPEQGVRRLLSGINIARRRRVLSRVLLSMTLFSLFCLVYVGLFPAVAELNFGIDSDSATYKWLYATWGLGACLGAIAVGSWLAARSKSRLIVVGFAGFAASLAAFAVVRSAVPAFPIGFVLGFCYFLTATSMITMLQVNLHDGERAAVMPLWFMSFGGTVTLGNLAFGPVVDWIGARWVLLGGAGFALFLARWCDLRRLLPGDFLVEELASEPLQPTDTAGLDEHHGP
jgi:MFS family permease